MKNELTLQKKILDRIKQENLRPTPKSVFRARDLVLWGLLGVFVAALSVGFGMIILVVKGADFGLFERLGLSTSEKIASSIPFFWILASAALATVAFINYRQTRGGYRLPARKFALAAALVAATLGSIVYTLDIAGYVDRAASENIPIYNTVVPLNTNVWLDPENGLLSGTVRSRESKQEFTLRDSNSVLWTVVGEDVSMPEGFSFSTGDRIRIIGTKIGDDKFRAVEIRPR